MWFELEHIEMKMYANANTCRTNNSLTIARKYQLRFAHFIMSTTPNILLISTTHIVKNSNKILINKMISIIPGDKFECHKQIKFKGTSYKVNFLLTWFTDEVNGIQIDKIIG